MGSAKSSLESSVKDVSRGKEGEALEVGKIPELAAEGRFTEVRRFILYRCSFLSQREEKPLGKQR